MRKILVLVAIAAAVAVAKCDSPSEDNSATNSSATDYSSADDTEYAEDGLYESSRSPLDKAANVEDVLQDSADDRRDAIDEATNGS